MRAFIGWSREFRVIRLRQASPPAVLPGVAPQVELPQARLSRRRGPLLLPLRFVTDMSSSNAGRTSGTPRIDSVATACQAADPANPSDRRTAGSALSRQLRSW